MLKIVPLVLLVVYYFQPMKKLLSLLLMLYAFNGLAQKTTTDSVRTQLRIIAPLTTGWDYYFYADEKGHPPVLLAKGENVFTITTAKRNVNGLIYAKTGSLAKQTNNYSFNLKGKPTYIVIAANDGVLVKARRFKTSKYMEYRNDVPETDRKPW